MSNTKRIRWDIPRHRMWIENNSPYRLNKVFSFKLPEGYIDQQTPDDSSMAEMLW